MGVVLNIKYLAISLKNQSLIINEVKSTYLYCGTRKQVSLVEFGSTGQSRSSLSRDCLWPTVILFVGELLLLLLLRT